MKIYQLANNIRLICHIELIENVVSRCFTSRYKDLELTHTIFCSMMTRAILTHISIQLLSLFKLQVTMLIESYLWMKRQYIVNDKHDQTKCCYFRKESESAQQVLGIVLEMTCIVILWQVSTDYRYLRPIYLLPDWHKVIGTFSL